jgi:hypothetical protein
LWNQDLHDSIAFAFQPHTDSSVFFFFPCSLYLYMSFRRMCSGGLVLAMRITFHQKPIRHESPSDSPSVQLCALDTQEGWSWRIVFITVPAVGRHGRACRPGDEDGDVYTSIDFRRDRPGGEVDDGTETSDWLQRRERFHVAQDGFIMYRTQRHRSTRVQRPRSSKF